MVASTPAVTLLSLKKSWRKEPRGQVLNQLGNIEHSTFNAEYSTKRSGNDLFQFGVGR
jgi:hypothetical protein